MPTSPRKPPRRPKPVAKSLHDDVVADGVRFTFGTFSLALVGSELLGDHALWDQLGFILRPPESAPAEPPRGPWALAPIGEGRLVWCPLAGSEAQPTASTEVEPGWRKVHYLFTGRQRAAMRRLLEVEELTEEDGPQDDVIATLKQCRDEDREAFACFVELAGAVPVELGDLVEEARLHVGVGEFLILAQLEPGIVTLLREHPVAVGELLRHHLRHGFPTAEKRQQLVDGLREGLVGGFAALGITVDPRMIAMLDRIGPGQIVSWFHPILIKRFEEAKPSMYSALERMLGPALRELGELGCPPGFLALLGGDEQLRALRLHHLRILLEVARQTRGHPERLRALEATPLHQMKRKDVIPRLVALDRKWDRRLAEPLLPGLPAGVGPWRIFASLKDGLDLPDDIRKAVEDDFDKILLGERILAWRPLRVIEERPLVVLLHGPGSELPGGLAEITYGEFELLRAPTLKACVDSLEELWPVLLGRPLTPVEAMLVAARFHRVWGVPEGSFNPNVTEEQILRTLPKPKTPWFRGVAA